MKHARRDYDRIQDPANIIPSQEPVFLIRAQDVVGANAVRAWVLLAEIAGARPDILAAARAQADLMDEWVKKQVPDLTNQPHHATA